MNNPLFEQEPEQPKYAVLKWKDWKLLVDLAHNIGAPDILRHLIASRIQDAEVIRHQDLTAAPLFHSYASSIHSFMDLLKSRGMLTPSMEAEMTGIADHFHDAANKSEALEHRKLPT